MTITQTKFSDRIHRELDRFYMEPEIKIQPISDREPMRLSAVISSGRNWKSHRVWNWETRAFDYYWLFIAADPTSISYLGVPVKVHALDIPNAKQYHKQMGAITV